MWKALLSDQWASTSKFRKILCIALNRQHILVHFGDPLDVDVLTKDLPSGELKTKRVHRLLQRHFKSQKQSIIGPDLSHRRTLLDELLAAPAVDAAIMAAAVADWRPAQSQDAKIKKTKSSLDDLKLIENPDILATLAAHETQRPSLVVGFAAETENVVANGQSKLAAKKLDLLFANQATDTFNSDSVAITVIDAAGTTELAAGNKHLVARKMLQLIAERLKLPSAH